MNSDILIVLSATVVLAAFVGFLIIRRSLVSERLCLKCEKVTTHRRDYGVGPVMSHVMACLTLGWQSMTDRYYPFRCCICGAAYQDRPAEAKAHELKLDIKSQDGALGNWAGTGGVQRWDALKWHQKLLLIVLIGVGLAIFVLYWLARIKG
jgi:hypothetical protein